MDLERPRLGLGRGGALRDDGPVDGGLAGLVAVGVGREWCGLSGVLVNVSVLNPEVALLPVPETDKRKPNINTLILSKSSSCSVPGANFATYRLYLAILDSTKANLSLLVP